MKQYQDLLKQVCTEGRFKSDRTGTGTYSIFGHQMRFNLAEGFPLVTTKKIHLKSVIHELLWFLKGETNVRYLQENGVRIWDEWASETGDLGPIYGAQWRSWRSVDDFGRISFIDQIKCLLIGLKHNPDARRHIVSAWNVADLDDMALPPCHCLFQFYSHEMTLDERERIHNGYLLGSEDENFRHQELDHEGIPRRKLSCQLYQRSADVFLGVPFNIASYALLTMMIAQVTGHAVGEFIWTGGDCHLYANHLEQADLQLSREPYPLPKMRINPEVNDIDAFRFEDFELVGYEAHPHIKAEVAV